MFKEDLQGSSGELLFGQCLRLPGDLISLTHENQNVSSSDIINNIRAFTESLHPTSTSSFEGHPLQARQKQNWGRGFILLLPHTAALPGSDAGSDVIKPASSFVIQNRQTLCSMWCPMYRERC